MSQPDAASHLTSVAEAAAASLTQTAANAAASIVRTANEARSNMELQPDHDLLIRMDTKLDMVIKQGSDHEVRLKRLEAKDDALGGALAGGKIVWVFLALLVVVSPNILNLLIQAR